MAQTPLPEDAAPLELLRETGVPADARLLTIVVGSYNHHGYLQEAFQAIEASKVCDHLAIVFIDDGSSDDTLSLVGEYPFDPGLHVRIYAKRNAGLRDSFGSGLALTDTPFVTFIASDDLYDPHGLNDVLFRLQTSATDDICWIFQATYLEGRNGECVYGRSLIRMIDAPAQERLRQLSISFPKPLLLQSTVFATDLLRAAQPWQNNVRLDDWPTFIQVAKLALIRPVSMTFLPDITLCRYRLHPGGAHNNLERQLSFCLEVAQELVDVRYRADAIARIYIDIGLIHLFERRVGLASEHFLRAIVAKPSWSVIARAPRRLVVAVCSRIARYMQTIVRAILL